LTNVEVLPSDVYRVAQLMEGQKRMFTTAHVSQLKSRKLEYEPEETSDLSEEKYQETSEAMKVDDSGTSH